MTLSQNPYIQLMRLDKQIGIWLLVMPCLWGIAAAAFEKHFNIIDWNILYYCILFMLGSVVMRSAGCVINDYFDREIDKHVTRTKNRPLARGAIKPMNALILFAFLSLIGLCILLQFPTVTIIMGLFIFIPIILYPLMKRITYFPQLFLGLVYNIGVIMGYVTITKIFNPHILWLYASGVLITVAYDTIYAFADIKDDLKIGVKSTAIAWQKNPKLFICLCYALGGVCFSLFFQNNPLIKIALLGIGLAVMMKIYHWDIYNHDNSLRLFKSNFYLLAVLWLLIIVF
jgi:4-hydroxybenzoate polyprenyltransferase